jgi:UDP-N-acetylglucosamine acyltransferase
VVLGPGVVIGPRVRIGAETQIGPYAVIDSNTTIGRRNHIFQFAAIGAPPQIVRWHGEPSTVEIGDDNQIREFATIHRGSESGGMVTRIGSHTLVMTQAHIGHDCLIGDHVIIAALTGFAGHCIVDDWASVEGMCGVHQYCRIGTHAILAAGSKLAQDVPPYSMVAGAERARLVGVNEIGLQRRNFSADKIATLKSAMRTLFFSKLKRDEAIARVLAELGGIEEVRRLVEFIRNSQRGVVGRQRE